MTKNDEVFADVFSTPDNAQKNAEVKAPEAPVNEPETPPEPAPLAQKEASAVPPVETPQQPPVQSLPQEEYLALRRAREEAKETKTALEIERLKASNYERELAQFKQQQQQKPKDPLPDVWENPEGRIQHVEKTFEQKMLDQKIGQSEFYARREFGAEMIDKVDAWLRSEGAAIATTMLNDPSPYHSAVEAYRKYNAAQALAPHNYDLEKRDAELKAKWLAELQAQGAPAGQQAAPQSGAPVLPPKIAGAGGALGKAPPPSEDAIFRSVFTR